jgi:Putative zinc-finger
VTCEEACPLVNAYVDGELDIGKCLEVEAHLLSLVKYCDIHKPETRTLARRKSARVVTVLLKYQ